MAFTCPDSPWLLTLSRQVRKDIATDILNTHSNNTASPPPPKCQSPAARRRMKLAEMRDASLDNGSMVTGTLVPMTSQGSEAQASKILNISPETESMSTSTSPSTTPPAVEKQIKPFRFHDLPPELKNSIYDLCLVSPNPHHIVSRTIRTGKIVTTTHADPDHSTIIAVGTPSGVIQPFYPTVNLLRVSKRIHSEAAAILYGQATFIPVHGTACISFLRSIGSEIQYVRQLYIISVYEHFTTEPIIEMLMHAKRLQSLKIDSSFARMLMCYYPLDMAKMLWPLLKNIHLTRPKGEEGNKAVVDVVELIAKGYTHEQREADEAGKAGKFRSSVKGMLQDRFEWWVANGCL